MTLQDEVLAYIEKQNNVSFAELVHMFPQFKDGDRAICAPDRPNTIFWCDIQDEAASAIQSLIESGKAHFYPTSILTYVIDGMTLKLPLAKTARHYKKEHWCPVVIKRGPFEKGKRQ